MAMISDNWADALDPIVRMWFEQGFARRTPLAPMLYNELPSQRAYEEISGVGAVGIDAWEQWSKTREVGQVKFDQGYKTRFEHTQFALELAIDKTLVDDNQHAELLNMTSRLGDSAALKREVDAASVFNNAFDVTNYPGADGQSLCDGAHPLSPAKTGSTQNNAGTYPLTKTNVSVVREEMMAWTDDNGNKVAVTPNMILVPPQLEDEALEIANSVLDPSSGNNAINPQFGRFRVMTWHYLTDSNAWFMIDSMLMKNSLHWFNRAGVSILPKVEDKTLVATWIASMRYSYGYSDWRWIYGNNPS